MTFVETAASLEADDRPLAAAWAYECAFSTEPREYAWLLNGAVLYFVCLDPGFAAAHALPASFVALTGERFKTFLEAAESVNGPHPEIEFWRRYFAFVHLGGDPLDEHAPEWAERSFSARVYVAAYLRDADPQARRALLNELAHENTARGRYLNSLLSK